MENINVKSNVTEAKFVKFSYRAEDALRRKTTLKEAHGMVEDVVAATGGDMTQELVNLYEQWHAVTEQILDHESDIVRVGR